MTDNEIIKALECCKNYGGSSCLDCPYHSKILEHCSDDLCQDALDLINRQKAEIENLYHNLKCAKDHKEKLIEQSKLQKQILRGCKANVYLTE